ERVRGPALRPAVDLIMRPRRPDLDEVGVHHPIEGRGKERMGRPNSGPMTKGASQPSRQSPNSGILRQHQGVRESNQTETTSEALDLPRAVERVMTREFLP